MAMALARGGANWVLAHDLVVLVRLGFGLVLGWFSWWLSCKKLALKMFLWPFVFCRDVNSVCFRIADFAVYVAM